MVVQQEFQVAELSQEDLTEVLKRAQTLEVSKVTVPEKPNDLETFVRAAEEVGISREAVLQALREKMGHPPQGISPGDRVFAKSADGAFYVATVSQIKDGVATLRFDTGSDHALSLRDLRGFAILPGQKLQVKWPGWGWITVEVEKYDPQAGTVKATDGFQSKTFPLALVRLPVEKSRRQLAMNMLLFRVALLSAGIGGIIGALLMRHFS
jgi:hypothetical protein